MKTTASALAEIKVALAKYTEEVEATGMSVNTKGTYLRHANTFVRWLEDDFIPGERTDDKA